VLKNPFARSSAPCSGANDYVFVVSLPCFGTLLDHRPGRQRLFQQPQFFSETQLPRVVILESVMMAKGKEPQRWEHQKTPPLEFLDFPGALNWCRPCSTPPER
jgi:hypothetical protein